MKKYILGAVLSIGIIISPAFTHAAGLTDTQAATIINVVKASPSTPASAFISLITAFSGVTNEQAASLITVVQASPNTPANVFVPLLTSFTTDVPPNQTNITTSAPTITLTYPTDNANFTIGGNPIPIKWTVTNAPANSQVVYSLTQISSTGGGSIGGGTGQTLSPLPLGSSNNSANWQTGGNNLDRPGTYEIKTEIRNCNVAGCNVAPSGATALATSNAVRVNVLSAVTSATPTTAPVITVTVNDLAYNGSTATTTFGGTARIGWGVTPTGGTTCYAAGIGIDGGSDAINLGGSWTTPALYTNTTYGIKCTNSLGTTYKYVNISVPAQTNTTTTGTTAPTITLNGNNTSSRLNINVEFGRTATFNWGVTPTIGTSCSAAGTGVNGATGSGAIALSGTWTTPALYTNTTYGVACINRNSAGVVSGMVYKYADVTVAPQTNTTTSAPTINSFSNSLTSTPVSVTSGQPTTLRWDITPSGTGTTCRLSETSPTATTWYDYGRMLLSSTGTGTSNLTAETTYRIDCRNNEGWTSWKAITIPVTAATAPVASTCTWSGGLTGVWGGGCNANVGATTLLSTQSPLTIQSDQNSTSGYSGSITFSCVNGVFTKSNLLCNAPAAAAPGAPTINYFNPISTSVASGATPYLDWLVTPASGTTATCGITGNWSGSISQGLRPVSTGGWGANNITSATTYTLTCTTSGGGSTSRTTSVGITAAAAPAASSCTWSGGLTGVWGGGCNANVGATTLLSTQSPLTIQSDQNSTSGYSGSITFSCVNGVFTKSNLLCNAPAAAAPTVTLTSAASSVNSGQSTTLEWHVSPTTAACSLSETGTFNGTIYPSVLSKDQANWDTSGLTTDTTYTLSCTNSGGTTPAVRTVTVPCGSINGRTNLTTTSWAGYTFCPSDTANGIPPSSLVRPNTTNGVGQYTWTCGTNSCSASISSVGMISGTNQTASALNAVESATQSQNIMQGTTDGFSYTFTQDMYRGVQGSEVVALQRALHAEGLFAGEATGNFYDVTREAVIAFQIKYGINPTGYVGSVTREKLNALY